MFNILVVLVPVCIGLTSGFIIPSGIREMSENGNYNNDFDRKRSIEIDDVSQKTLQEKELIRDNVLDADTSESDDNQNKLEKDLYEDFNKKNAKVNERSYIYIKQRNRKPLRHNIMNQATSKNLNERHTNNSYLLNRNNIYEEFRRRFSVGYIDRNSDNNHLNSKTDECNGRWNGFRCDHYNNQNLKKYGDKKELFIDKFLLNVGFGSLTKNVTKMEKVKLKSDGHYYYDKVNSLTRQGHVNNIYSSGKSKEKKIDATDMKIFFPKNRKYGNDGDNSLLDRLLKEALEDELIARKNSARVNHYGFQYCRDCANKAKKPNLPNGIFIDKKCKCKVRNAGMKNSIRQ